MAFPDIDPVAFSIGPLAIRWYALAYLAGIIGGWRLSMALARRDPTAPKPVYYDEWITWLVIGIVVGGRLGYVLFYNFGQYIDHPLEALKLWHGGMSFHGGLMGVIVAAILFTRKHKIPFFSFIDIIACVVPIGLGLGRLANFVNGELYGRETSSSWGIIFPRGGDAPRHPSQLYEAFAEGLVLLIIMLAMQRMPKIRERKGFLSGAFLALYGVMRFFIEFFREPDMQVGFLYGGATMGQLLSLPMIAAGIAIIFWSGKRKNNVPS